MKRISFTLCLVFLTLITFAQKLPDVQPSNMLAPANIKIDGKSTEWNDTYAAENKRTELSYNLANDDKNLYLILKSSTATIANKIMLGGITFAINTQGKKKEKDAVAVTYPLIVRGNRNQGGRGGARPNGGQGGFQNRNQQTITAQQRDSIALAMHKTQLATVKEIKISGIKSITDSLISIYNEYGIKAVASFDAKGAYVYELAIPLNLLEITTADAKEFVYQIKVNGMSNMGFGGGFGGNRGGNFGGGGGGGGAGRGNRGFGGGNAGGGQDLMSPTDFWGKYILVKK